MVKSIYIKRNRKIANNRGRRWRDNLKKGKLDTQENPSQIKILRAKKGFTQDELAKVIEKSISHYGAIENGRTRASWPIAMKIAKELRTKVDNIFEPIGDKLLAIK